MKALAIACGLLLTSLPAFAEDVAALRAERDKLVKGALWKEALDHYRENLMTISDTKTGEDLAKAIQSIQQLNEWKQFDSLVEEAISQHPANPALLQQAAIAYQQAPHYGRLIAGEFERTPGGYGGWHGGRRGGPDVVPEASAGTSVQTHYRDRIRSLQLFRQALSHSQDANQQSQLWSHLASYLNQDESWKLQTLTPLETLPEWGEPGPSGSTEGAPWTNDGPVLYEVPASWDAAKNDGQRWRFALAEQARLSPGSSVHITLQLARFSLSQFGEETLASFGWWRTQDPDSAKGILEVDTLAEDECIAKTSDGIRRFKLPASHHFIALYRSVFDQTDQAGDTLTQIFLNRRQYHKAREVLEQTIAKHGAGGNDHRKKLLAQITGNWGRFEPADTVPAGKKPQIPLVFRNATGISLTASPVDMEAVLKDTIDYLKSNPRELDWQRIHPTQIASRLIQEKKSEYIGKPAATWKSDLTPRDLHRDTRTSLDVPIQQAGAWWITGKIDNGNEFHTLVWIIDSVLVQRSVGGKLQWWLADADTGAPVAQADIDFFGYRINHLDRKLPLQRRTEILTKEFKRTTDADGKTLLKPGDWDNHHRWLAIARSQGRSPTFFGFQNFHIQNESWDNTNRDLTYGITDRPLYKPGDTVHAKFHLRNVGYFEPDNSRWANQAGTLTIHNGRGEEALKIENLKTDALGSVEAEFIIPKDAPLGRWQANFLVRNRISANASFQVEEYRKPEYEVKVEAPTEPIKLGDKFTATVKANYFHGAPVRKAEVEIIVKRSSVTEPWFPMWRWDWLYGRGAWWIQPAAAWHPSWHHWGCMPPPPPWWHGRRHTPDELILKKSVPIGEDGTANLEIDTAPAKDIHGDMDARYTIEARVTDASRREERGTGSVTAARKPFEVVVWTNRGHAKSGDVTEATISAASLAGKPVANAKGTLKLYQLSMNPEGRVIETEIQSWPITTDSEGKASQRFAAPATGQYRLAAQLSFKEGEPVEGASILNIHSPGRDDPKHWNFGPLELIADKSEYKPGESVKLRVNSDRTNAHVWLFLHIAGHAGREAKRIQLDGKSLEVDVPLTLKDMPNMFLEGITVHGANVHTAVRQILLPPVSKLIEVTLEPAKSKVKPREKSSLVVTLKDADGKPVTGTTTLTIYDKSLEAITGGSNVGPIHENFWNWKNTYYQRGASNSLPYSTGNLLRPKTPGMQQLGRFAEEMMDAVDPFSDSGGGVRNFLSARMAKKSAMPMPSAAPTAKMAMDISAVDAFAGEALPGAAPANPIAVRKDFADLLKWSGSIQTDANGRAEIPLIFPDNLTTWKARVWHLGKDTTVGEGTTEIITSKELLVRLQAPRFLVERDESVLSAVVHNDHDSPKTVKVSLEIDGQNLTVIEGTTKTVEIAARSEARIDWRVKAIKEGEATLRMKADAGDDGDAVERTLPILVHGMSRQDAWSVVVGPDKDSARILMEVPEQRRPDQSILTVRFSPTIAGAVVDAIPYLASYPHGCTEQTLNRFVPLVIGQNMLRSMGTNLAEVKAKRTNLNPQELGNAADRAAQWKLWQNNPVFDELEMEKMVAKGVERLTAMQNSDGGWGWFSGYGEYSYPHTTAVVVHGLIIAKANGAQIPDRMLDSGIAWLQAYEKKQTNALQLHVERQALRDAGKKIKNDNRYEKSKTDAIDAFVRMILGETRRDSEPMLAFLHRDRMDLPVYAKCLLGLEHHRKGDAARRDEVLRMIAQFLKRDPENQTAYLDLKNSGYWWFWYGSEVEAHAWYLKLLAAAKPKDADTRGLVKYLVNNRKNATYWNSTRDTAYAIEAIADYFKASGEGAPEMEVEIIINGNRNPIHKVTIDRDNLFTFDGTVTLTGESVPSGANTVEIHKTGKGTLYANAYLEVFTLEDKLRAAGLEVKVQRKISKLIELEKSTEVPDDTGLVAKQQAERFRREPLADGATVKSGDRIEVELILESKNDYEYLLFSDAKAAGFEALDALSGYISGDSGFSAYMEPRDQSVDFFIRALPRGTHTLRYQLRAEAPGTYKALPAEASAMYAPELRGNSEDMKISVQ